MKEHPILFSAPMVQAILEGRKTQTRRIVKRQPNIDAQTGDWLFTYSDGSQEVSPIEKWIDIQKKLHCPYGKVGDRLWVRETFAEIGCIGWPIDKFEYAYRSDFAHNNGKWEGYADMCFEKWKPSIFMPRDASRITLEITDIRVERLCSIGDDEARLEGVEFERQPITAAASGWKHYLSGKHNSDSPRHSFQTLWEKINGPQSWENNPYVWVISFVQL